MHRLREADSLAHSGRNAKVVLSKSTQMRRLVHTTIELNCIELHCLLPAFKVLNQILRNNFDSLWITHQRIKCRPLCFQSLDC